MRSYKDDAFEYALASYHNFTDSKCFLAFLFILVSEILAIKIILS